ncbi:MAG: DUF4270 domain-containing protein [Prevotella sp.]|nr:DUF4270 domain-containing protein [Prevotella sp.]
MNRIKLLMGIAMMTVAISSCDDSTDSIGSSLTSNVDKFEIVSDEFTVSTNSITVDSVLARSEYCYLGRIKDPETGAYVTSDYLTQFAVLENESDHLFADKDLIVSKDEQQQIIADSCHINIVINQWKGDSLTAMKMIAYEMDKPIEENQLYYSNFDPIAKGYVSEDGFKQPKTFSVVDMRLSETELTQLANKQYSQYINVQLNKPYTDRNGVTYNNYGTYILRNYFQHPEYFKNSYSFIHNVCPGFYFRITDGLGEMSQISATQLTVYYRFQLNGEDTVYVGDKVFNGTSEVLQTTRISNDQDAIRQLAADNTCTYIKTPAGIFTEVTLPVDEIKAGHENDTITSAKIAFTRLNSTSEYSDALLYQPTKLLMIPKDSLTSFFENRNLPNNIVSYIATYSSQYNTYTYENISELINYMYYTKKDNGGSSYVAAHPEWNKVVLIPVTVTETSQSSSYGYATTLTTSISNEMNITSLRLVGGSANPHAPITISVIYNKTKK